MPGVQVDCFFFKRSLNLRSASVSLLSSFQSGLTSLYQSGTRPRDPGRQVFFLMGLSLMEAVLFMVLTVFMGDLVAVLLVWRPFSMAHAGGRPRLPGFHVDMC